MLRAAGRTAGDREGSAVSLRPMLYEFLLENRDEILRRSREKLS
jgi:hypothetical protein